jgi:hypothetical protein
VLTIRGKMSDAMIAPRASMIAALALATHSAIASPPSSDEPQLDAIEARGRVAGSTAAREGRSFAPAATEPLDGRATLSWRAGYERGWAMIHLQQRESSGAALLKTGAVICVLGTIGLTAMAKARLERMQPQLAVLRKLEAEARSIEAAICAETSALERRLLLPVLDSVQLASPCNEPWEGMVGDERVRHCARCDKNVYAPTARS